MKARTHLLREMGVQHYQKKVDGALEEAKEEVIKRPELLQVDVLHHKLVRLEGAARRASHTSKDSKKLSVPMTTPYCMPQYGMQPRGGSSPYPPTTGFNMEQQGGYSGIQGLQVPCQL